MNKLITAACLLVAVYTATVLGAPQEQQQQQIGEALALEENLEVDHNAPLFEELSNFCVGEHNAQRSRNGRGALAGNAQLATAAERHNAVMVEKNCFSHQCPGEPGLGDRVSQTGYRWGGVGENIAKGYADCQAAVNGWMNSEGHRNNILGNYVHIGCHRNANGNHYTCVFGRPL